MMSDEAERLYCTFHTAGRLFGVPVLDVKEVTTETTSTRIPHAPREVIGYVNIRGHVFLALSLAELLAIPNHHPLPDSQLVLFKPSVGPSFGIVVDRVGDIVAISADQSESFSGAERGQLDSEDRGACVSHICKLDDQLLIVLDPRRFLPRIEQSLQNNLKQ